MLGAGGGFRVWSELEGMRERVALARNVKEFCVW